MIVNQKKINKPWGHEIIWSHCEEFTGKILVINSGCRLSRQYHKIKEETILVLSGTLKLELGNPSDEKNTNFKCIDLQKGQSFHITPGLIHRFSAEYGEVELAEVSTSYLEDVVRIEDDYNREK
tara:strand:- start:3189 stop:3560 length:372 start_codon:yes stop_codon:yes gene_type:complete